MVFVWPFQPPPRLQIECFAIHFLQSCTSLVFYFKIKQAVMMVSLKREREDEVDDDDNEETGNFMLTYVCPTFDGLVANVARKRGESVSTTATPTIITICFSSTINMHF